MIYQHLFSISTALSVSRLLDTFSMTLRIIGAKDDLDLDNPEEKDNDADVPEVSSGVKSKSKIKVADSWDDDSEEPSESEGLRSYTANTLEAQQLGLNKKDWLILVLKAFKLLEVEFGAKFYEIGASTARSF
ncbi:hypothetical protein H9L39_08898 [Fusarium oxysporum f. sp. albedinis]|nr:hypothetical protein H9L39_08898 [Fusarium oxysporum f. sp. albedinis]